MPPARSLRLTPDHVARVPPFTGTSGRLAGRTDLPTEDEWGAVADMLLSQAPPSGDVWIFGYGSLIWNPEFDFAEERLGTLHGWHRSFCIGWVRIYRGTPERPGIMLGMDRGGSCRGVVFRLPDDTRRDNLLRVIRREMPIRWERVTLRWINVKTDRGVVRALGMPTRRDHRAYLSGLTEDQIVESLATAAGERGSMADYLLSTINHLADRGIHDPYLWRLQDRVARRIEEGPPHPLFPLG